MGTPPLPTLSQDRFFRSESDQVNTQGPLLPIPEGHTSPLQASEILGSGTCSSRHSTYHDAQLLLVCQSALMQSAPGIQGMVPGTAREAKFHGYWSPKVNPLYLQLPHQGFSQPWMVNTVQDLSLVESVDGEPVVFLLTPTSAQGTPYIAID